MHDTLETRSSQSCVAMPNIFVLVQTIRTYVQRLARKIGPLVSCLSRSLSFIGTDMHNNNNNNHQISIAPYGRNFRGANPLPMTTCDP